MEQAISKSAISEHNRLIANSEWGLCGEVKQSKGVSFLFHFRRVMDRKRHFKTNRERKDIVETGLLGAPTESLVATGLRAGRSLFRTGRDAGAYQNADARVSVARTIFYDPHHIRASLLNCSAVQHYSTETFGRQCKQRPRIGSIIIRETPSESNPSPVLTLLARKVLTQFTERAMRSVRRSAKQDSLNSCSRWLRETAPLIKRVLGSTDGPHAAALEDSE